MFSKAFIPYGGYYSTPFCKWQTTFANINAIELGATTAKRWLAGKGWDTSVFDYTYLGITIGQPRVFYGSTWFNAMVGAPDTPGMTVMQACSTTTTSVYNAALAVEMGTAEAPLCMMVDRTSNGPHTIWPNPAGPGGEVLSENWNMDNINSDPSTGLGMIVTAENVAKEAGLKKEQADVLAVRRYEQYLDALADDRAFQRRYMFPVEVALSRKKSIMVEEDGGVTPCTAEGLAKLKPVMPGGIHSFGSQTHPADGNAAILVTSENRARELSSDNRTAAQIISYGYARTTPAHMPKAPVPAAKMALERAGLSIGDIKVIKTHNPFAANDLYMAKEFNIDAGSFNNYGSSMIFGHPQAPTVARLLIEGIEEAYMLGGGYVMVAGCAAGDTGAAMIIKVG